MSIYIFAWTASITYGIYAIVAKLVGKYKIENYYLFSFTILLLSGFLMAGIAYTQGIQTPTNWIFILLASFFIAINSISYLAALKALDVSVMSPLFNIRVAITVIMGYLFLNEVLTLSSTFLILIIFIAGFFAAMDERFSFKTFFSRSMLLGLIFMTVLSTTTIFINRAVDQTDYWTAMFWMSLLAIVFSFVLTFPKFKKDLKKTRLKDYSGVALLALIGGVGDLAAYKAFSGNVGISSVIISLPLSMIFVFLLAFWKPKLMEKHTLKVYIVRFAAAAIMIWGALQLSY